MVWSVCCLISCVPSLLMTNLCPHSVWDWQASPHCLLHGLKHLDTRVHTAGLSPALCWDWTHCLEQSNSGCLSRNSPGVVWLWLKLSCGKGGRKLHADLGSGFAAAQPPLWVRVQLLGGHHLLFRAFSGTALCGEGLKSSQGTPSASFSVLFTAHQSSVKKSQQSLHSRTVIAGNPFSKALPLPWMMLVLNMSAHLPGDSSS